MNRVTTLLVMVILSLAFAACTVPVSQLAAPPAQPTVVTGERTTPLRQVTVKPVSDQKLGTILIDANRMTLYRYANDGPNVSNCTGQCAQNWPPLLMNAGDEPILAGGVAGKLSTITRSDGGKQVTYESKPLYLSASDTKPGDRMGQGVGGVWFVVQTTAPKRAADAPVYSSSVKVAN
jgi:predicted lipoprotein with Yx(FWY)xxD motif